MRRLLALAGSLTVAAGLLAAPSPGRAEPLRTDGEPLCATQEPTAGTTPTLSHADRGDDHRIATFNILHSQGSESNLLGQRIPLIAQAMVDADADAYGLQEVVGRWDPVTNTAAADAPYVAEQLAQSLADAYGESWNWCWFMANPHFPGEPDTQPGGGGGPATEGMIAFNPANPGLRLGEAIVTRFAVDEAANRRMAPRSYEAPLCDPVDVATGVPQGDVFGCPFEAVFDGRELQWARLVDDDGERFDMFNTHIAHHLTRASQLTKQAMVEAMLLTIDEWEDPSTPTFFTGDFNSVEDHEADGEVTDRRGTIVAAGFADTWRDHADAHGVADSAGLTSDQDITTDDTTPTVDARIDYVFLRCPDGSAATTTDSVRFADTPTADVVPGQWLWPSDHLAVVSGARCA